MVWKFSSHQNPKVKESVLKTMERLAGQEAERSLLGFIKDPDFSVRRAAILGLARLNSGNPRYIQLLLEKLKEWREAEGEEAYKELIVILNALSFFDPLYLPQKGEFEDILLALARPPNVLQKALPTFTRTKMLPDTVRIAALEALANLNGKRGWELIEEIATTNSESLGLKARELLERRRQEEGTG